MLWNTVAADGIKAHMAIITIMATFKVVGPSVIWNGFISRVCMLWSLYLFKWKAMTKVKVLPQTQGKANNSPHLAKDLLLHL